MNLKLDEYGDKIDSKSIYQGCVLLASLATFLGCLCVRGCQEFQKKVSKDNIKPVIVNRQNIHN